MDVMYKKVLVPIDGSKNSFKALAHAIALARYAGAELGVLYVSVLSQQLPLASQIEGHKIPTYSVAKPEEFAKKILSEGVKCVPSTVKVQAYNEVGSPTIVITEFAEQNNYDVIVIGSRGLGSISGLVLGSVSNYVVHAARCPVLVVK
ncbi:hypothetical protein AXX12_13990 [Anaerosporomusa subterranea]|uniref:UspA domain-containing protein n=1 Tax=Anaerosporomusa subterranea TaxID=1794912 RepID=A0A154BMW1_ANASB|nr:universal stress protein [Anaerosporomusa subterranea]KYZ75266.1 hypothetical protein AXX12_13990 [Anaerosporomusa subterranea]